MEKFNKLCRKAFLIVALFNVKTSLAQTISPRLFGVNAWMSDTIGDPNNCQDPPCIRYGKVHKNWNKIRDSYASIVRYGGIAPDKNIPTKYQYLRMVDSIRAKGMEPLIQVPFYNYRYTAQQAADIVHYINIEKGRNVKYWIIANEPNLSYSYTTAAQIAAYFKPFASAMKAVDPSILIVGPETASFKQTITNGLTNPGGPDDITGKDPSGNYYLDVFSFHTYPLGNGTQTRATAISKLTAAGSFQDDLTYLNTRLAACDSYHHRSGSHSLKTAVTEANICYTNSPSDNLNGVGTNSFIGGQFVAELYGIGARKGVDFINLWSVIEGGGNIADNCGYIDPNTGNKKPLYYHFQLMAENFKGNSIGCNDNQANVKSFACINGQNTCVLIMNQDLASNFSYTLRLNNAAIGGANPLKINADANIAKEYTDVIPNQSTVLLTFDAAGNLVKKCDYSLAVHAVANLAPTCTYYFQNHTVDLTITAPSLSPSQVVAGGTVFLTSTVFNSGDTIASYSNIGYYLSADSIFDGSDVFLSHSPGSNLNGGSGALKNATVTIPAGTLPGNYYLLYVADYSGLVSESTENNNMAFAPLSVTAIAPPPVADVLIQNPSTDHLTVQAGANVNSYCFIRNAGNGSAASSNVGYYLSADTIQDASDVFLSNSQGGLLAPGASSYRSVQLTIPAGTLPGNYYLLYFADYSGLVAESSENNNIGFSPLSVTAIAPPPVADVLIQNPSTDLFVLQAGADVNSYCFIHNTGNGPAASSNIGYYLSLDTSRDASDIFLSDSQGGLLAPGGSSYRSIPLTIPALTNPGSYYLLYCADYTALLAEANENNNNAFVMLTISPPLNTGISESSTKQFSIYPNPSRGKFTIDMETADRDEPFRLKVVNLLGEEVYQGDLFFRNNREEILLPDETPAGVYIIRLTKGKDILSGRIVLNR